MAFTSAGASTVATPSFVATVTSVLRVMSSSRSTSSRAFAALIGHRFLIAFATSAMSRLGLSVINISERISPPRFGSDSSTGMENKTVSVDAG